MEKNLLSEVTGINLERFRVVHNGFDEKLLQFRDKKVDPQVEFLMNGLGNMFSV